MTVISVEHLYKSYGNLMAVKDLSFQVHEGSCVSFLGPNGAGKTTMMKALYGKCIPDDRPETAMSVFGHDPRNAELKIKTLSGVVPQEDNLDVELNVRQNLEIFSRFYGLSRKIAHKRIDELLEFMELKEKKTARVRELSGGMKRRLIIARALLNKPALLILDEPTTGLDPQVRQLIWDKLRTLMRQGTTILLTTHYMEEAFQLADHVVIMDHGEKSMEGNPHELLRDHVETHVLELIVPERSNDVDALLVSVKYRKEPGDERVVYYSDDIEALSKVAGKLDFGQYFLRQTNLEDLFLKATGRRLNETQ